MKAICWYGKQDVRVETVPDPQILNPRDAIIRVTSTAICGSDLHLYNNVIPSMKAGDILGHEFMGEVVEVGEKVENLAAGDRVVVPFTIACGNCFFCQKKMWSLCDNSNPNATAAAKLYGYSGSGLFGYSHLFGGYAGGQAEYVRVPFADVGPMKIGDHVSDEQALFLSDILPTGYMAAENANINEGDTVAVWGCGPVGQFAIQSAWWFGASRVIAIDHVEQRLMMARDFGNAETINFDKEDVSATLDVLTSGLGPDCCIDAVGLEAHGTSPDAIYDRVKQSVYLGTDRIHALRQAIYCCRKGGTVSIPGVYGGVLDKMPFGAAFGKGLHLAMGQTHVHRYLQPLLDRITGNGHTGASVANPLSEPSLSMREPSKAQSNGGGFDPTYIISHRLPLSEAPDAYRIFNDYKGECTKVVLHN
jgi:threonine dehydrogenase-like Zn-dependent dehydrogenase